MVETDIPVRINRKASPAFVIEFEGEDTPPLKLDPLTVICKLQASGVDIESGDPTKLLDTLRKFREIVGLTKLTDSESMELMNAFFEYIDRVKKNIAWLRNLQGTSASSQTETTPNPTSAST